MKDQSKTKQVLIQELVSLRERNAELEQSESERKRDEEAFKDHEAELTSIYENAPLIMILVDKEWTIRKTNAFTAQFVSGAVGDMINLRCGQSLHCIHSLDAPDGCGFGPSCRECTLRLTAINTIETGQGHHEVEARMSLSDGGEKREVIFLLSTARLTIKKQIMAMVSMQDITERKQVEEALRVSLEKYRVLFESFPLGITISDKSGKIIEGNFLSEQILGIAREAHTQRRIDSKEWQIIRKDGTPMPADEYASTRALRENSLIENVEMGIVKDKGEITWISVTAAPIPLEGYGVAIAYGDITERKQAEEALKKSAQLLRDTGEMAKVGGWELDLSTKEVSWTEEVGRIHGVEPGYKPKLEEAMNFYLLESRPSLRKALKKATETGEPYDLESLFIPSGSKDKIWVRSLGRAVYSGGKIVKLTGTFQNIDKYKRAEEALRLSEENFRRSLDESPLGVRIVTEDGETIHTNQAILDIYGYDSVEELRTNPVEKRYTPKSFAEHQIRKEKRKRGDYDPSEYDISIIRKNGEVHHLQVFRKAVLWDGEKQFQVIYQDITKRRQAEEALHASEKQMRALAGRLQEVREEERTKIAREIHDELGGALTGMKVDVSFLITSALKIENEADRTSLLAGMDSVTKSIDTTIHAVRRIAMELRPGILDDLGLVAALEWQLIDFEKRTGIRCEFFPPVEDISLDADRSTALFRIFQEALTNVARHSGATEVHVRFHADADSSTLEVEDNGKGIEKEKSLSSKSLGLLGMRERAEMFGGRITVTGTPGTGTTVKVEIPPSSSTSLLAAGKFISLADME